MQNDVMVRSLISVVILLLALSSSAAEHFLPVGPSTRVRLTNSSSDTAVVSIDCGSSAQIVILLGETREWSDLQGCSVARIVAEANVRIEATSSCAKCAAVATTVVLDRNDAL